MEPKYALRFEGDEGHRSSSENMTGVQGIDTQNHQLLKGDTCSKPSLWVATLNFGV